MKKHLAALAIALSALAMAPATAQADSGTLTAPTLQDATAKAKATGQRVLLRPDATKAAADVIEYYFLQNKYPGKCLDLENWGSGRYLQQYPCHQGANQEFQFRWSEQLQGWEIKPLPTLSANECVDVEHYGAGHRVQRYPCTLSSNQIWDVWSYSDGYREIVPHSNTSKCLDASDWGNGIPVQVYPCQNPLTNDNQDWWLY